MTFKDRKLNSMTFQALKMKFLNSMACQVFHDLYSVRTLLYQVSKNLVKSVYK